ncbi:MAG: hypothetical protein KIT84_13680 [Labilithrix sp.]|nr:hypothetical protein [Labilithrix sp.]MCW5812069.1 hypothetical protein [Labilithrix sp.]
MCTSPYRCSSPPEAFTPELVFVATLGVLWLLSIAHVWSVVVVSIAIATETVGSVASLSALVAVVALPFLAHKVLSVGERRTRCPP